MNWLFQRWNHAVSYLPKYAVGYTVRYARASDAQSWAESEGLPIALICPMHIVGPVPSGDATATWGNAGIASLAALAKSVLGQTLARQHAIATVLAHQGAHGLAAIVITAASFVNPFLNLRGVFVGSKLNELCLQLILDAVDRHRFTSLSSIARLPRCTALATA